MRRQIRDDVQSGAEKQQREYFLRKQMESIQKELGDDDGSVVEEYRAKIEEAGMPGRGARAGRAVSWPGFERMGRAGRARASMIRSYLDWLIAVPWSKHLGRAARSHACA